MISFGPCGWRSEMIGSFAPLICSMNVCNSSAPCLAEGEAPSATTIR